MKTEYEARILEINKDEFIKKIEDLDAVKIADYYQRRYIYDFNPVIKGKWIRLRDTGKETTLTIKEITKDTIDGTKELEIKVSDFNTTDSILEELGYRHRLYQENKRTRYMLNNIEIDIDTWPMVPTYVELEGDSEENILEFIKKLGYSEEDIITYGVSKIYNHYGLDIDSYKELKFENEE